MIHWKKFGTQVQVVEGGVGSGSKGEGGLGSSGKAKLMNKSKVLSKLRSLNREMASYRAANDTDNVDRVQKQVDYLHSQMKKAN